MKNSFDFNIMKRLIICFVFSSICFSSSAQLLKIQGYEFYYPNGSICINPNTCGVEGGSVYLRVMYVNSVNYCGNGTTWAHTIQLPYGLKFPSGNLVDNIGNSLDWGAAGLPSATKLSSRKARITGQDMPWGYTVADVYIKVNVLSTYDPNNWCIPNVYWVGKYRYNVGIDYNTCVGPVCLTNIAYPPNAGIDCPLTICEGETVTSTQLFNTLLGTPETGGVWSPTLAGAGTYTYTVSAGSCPNATAQVVVSEQAAPDAGIDCPLIICEGTTLTTTQLFNSLLGTPQVGGVWSPALSGAGTYTYTVSATSPCIADVTSQVVVSEQAAPNAGANCVLTICEGETVTSPALFGALLGTPQVGGVWSPALSGAGTYTYTVSASPCTGDATAQIVVSEQAAPDPGKNCVLTICEGETVTSPALFGALLGTPETGGVWSPILEGAGTYTYTVSATSPCTADATAQIVVSEQAAPNAGVDCPLTICEGETLTLTQLFNTLLGTPQTGGVWSPALSGAGTYTYTVSATSPCTGNATAQVVVSEREAPDAGVNCVLTICEGATVTSPALFGALLGTPETGGVWSPALAGAGTYTYTISATSPCTADATAQIVVSEQAAPDAGIDCPLTICEGTTLTTGQLFNTLLGTPETGGVWSPTLAGAGTYTYTVSATSPCTGNVTAQVVVSIENINVDAGSYNSLIHTSSPITVTGFPTDSNGAWSGSGISDNGNGTANFNPSGLSYSIPLFYTYTSTNGCVFIDTTIIEVELNNVLKVKVFLQGPLNGTGTLMNTALNSGHLLPGQDVQGSNFFGIGTNTPIGQPYNVAPWNYNGTEGNQYGENITNPGSQPYASTVVDWVLVSVRETNTLAASEIFKTAALLHNDGNVEFLTPIPSFNSGIDHYIVIEHRNHLPIMSNAIQIVGGELNVDFTSSDSWIQLIFGFPSGKGQKSIPNCSVYAMLAGNSHANPYSEENFINSNDGVNYDQAFNKSYIYIPSDYNLSGAVNNLDKFYIIYNFNLFTLLPH